MKKLIFALSCLLCMTMILPTRAALTVSEIRQHARFISDRMGYELQLNTAQYNDVYEINYDFLSSIRYLTDNLVYGYDSDVDEYYNYLDIRNEDLSYVLSRSQYVVFMSKDYFYTPLYLNNSRCTFRIYSVYSNITSFFFSLPTNFYSYAGIHNRSHYRSGFYVGRYTHDRYTGKHAIREDKTRYATHRYNDFRVSSKKNAESRYNGNNRNKNNGTEKRNNSWDYQPVNRTNNNANTGKSNNGYKGNNRNNGSSNSSTRPNSSSNVNDNSNRRPNNSSSSNVNSNSSNRPNNSGNASSNSSRRQSSSANVNNSSNSRPSSAGISKDRFIRDLA